MANLATKAGVEGRQRLTIHTPLINLTKAQIIRRRKPRPGRRFFPDPQICYDPTDTGQACGRWGSCLLRKKRLSGSQRPRSDSLRPLSHAYAHSLPPRQRHRNRLRAPGCRLTPRRSISRVRQSILGQIPSPSALSPLFDVNPLQPQDRHRGPPPPQNRRLFLHRRRALIRRLKPDPDHHPGPLRCLCRHHRRRPARRLRRFSPASPVALSAGSVAGIFDGIRTVAQALAPTPRRPNHSSPTYARRQRQVTVSVRSCATPTVVLIEWTDPIFVMSNWAPELVELANGRSLLGHAGQLSHSLLAKNPALPPTLTI